MIHNKTKKEKLILPGLCLAILIVSLSSCNNSDKKDKQDHDSASLLEVHENNNTVNGYITFVTDDQNKMSLDHSYTNEAFLKLTAATKAMAKEIGYDVQTDLGKVNKYADEIGKDPFETTHADNIREAADILTSELQSMQQAKYPTLKKEASELRDASISIKPEVLTLEQKDALKSFFGKAALLLEKMN